MPPFLKGWPEYREFNKFIRFPSQIIKKPVTVPSQKKGIVYLTKETNSFVKNLFHKYFPLPERGAPAFCVDEQDDLC